MTPRGFFITRKPRAAVNHYDPRRRTGMNGTITHHDHGRDALSRLNPLGFCAIIGTPGIARGGGHSYRRDC